MCESDAFLSKKVANCLFVWEKSYNFAADLNKKHRKDEKSEST